MTTNLLETKAIAKALGGKAAKPATQIVGELTLDTDTGALAMPSPLFRCRNGMLQRSGR